MWACGALGLAGALVRANVEEELLWRLYRTQSRGAEPSVLSVRYSPRGNVCVSQGSAGAIWTDGFRVRVLREPPEGGYPIHESRSGQLLSLHPDGLQEYGAEGWTAYGVEVVQQERAMHPLKRLRDAPVLPADRDRAFILLPSQLIKHDIRQGRTTVLRRADEAGLGEFLDLVEARDGDVWVTGSLGVARIPGPSRRLSADSVWSVAQVPAAYGLRLVDRAFEDEVGGLVLLGERASDGARFLVRWEGTRWSEPLEVPAETRACWGGPDGEMWALTRTQLHRRTGATWAMVSIPGLEGARLADVCLESEGVFWLGTSAGLVRHAPRPWRAVHGVEGATQPVRAIAESPGGRVWFVGPGEVLAHVARRWQRWAVPAPLAPLDPVRAAWIQERLVIADGRRGLVELDPESGEFEAVVHPEGRGLSGLVGRLSDGRWVVSTRGEGAGGDVRLEAFDGQGFDAFSGSREMAALGGEVLWIQDRRGDQRWVGTTEGLAVWNERTRTLTRATEASFGVVRALVEAPQGRLWCLAGNSVFENEGRSWPVVRFFRSEVRRLTALRDGTIWAVGETNLFRFGNGVWVEHAIEEGLPPGPLWDVWLDDRGELWAATEAGVRHYDREADNDAPTSVAMGAGGRTEFSTRERAALVYSGRDRWDYTVATRLLYATRLDQGAWSGYATGGVFVLTNLTAGQHQFAVRGMDPSLNEQIEPAVFEFSVFVPWYGEPRLMGVLAAALLIAASLAGLAINRHLQLKRSYAEVERIVAERTRQLEQANEELLHSQKMRALGTLAAGIAHDFNSILSIIKGSAQIIEANLGDPGKIRLRLERIRTMVDQGAGIVRAMLGLSRSSRDEWRPVEMGPFLEETVRLVGDQVHAGLVLRTETAPGLPPVRMAPDMLRQVLLNLVFNAADASPGRGEVVLRAGRRDMLPAGLVLAPGGSAPYLAIEVADQGHGMEPEVLRRIFEPFFTTKAFSTRKGTGLGLTMVYEIARETGLGLHVTSAPGKGSTFTVYLAMIAQEPVPRAPGMA